MLRWWFCRDVGVTADTDFTVERLINRANEDLAGGVGNVISRIVSLIHRYRGGTPPDPDARPLDAAAGLPERTRQLLREFEHRRAAQGIADAVTALNQHLEQSAPWKLAKDPAAAELLDAVLSEQLATARVIVEALDPITPSLAARARWQVTASPALPPLEPLIQRIDGLQAVRDHPEAIAPVR